MVPRPFPGRSSRGLRNSHGIYSYKKRGIPPPDRDVQRYVRNARRAVPSLTRADVPVLREWAKLTILSDIGFAILKNGDLKNSKDQMYRLLCEWRRLVDSLLNHSRELGLTPTARAQITGLRDRASFDLAAAASALNSKHVDIEDVPAEEATP